MGNRLYKGENRGMIEGAFAVGCAEKIAKKSIILQG